MSVRGFIATKCIGEPLFCYVYPLKLFQGTQISEFWPLQGSKIHTMCLVPFFNHIKPSPPHAHTLDPYFVVGVLRVCPDRLAHCQNWP